jgi:hypothetical protein
MIVKRARNAPLTSAVSLSESSSLPWIVVLCFPRSDYLETVERNTLLTFLCGVGMIHSLRHTTYFVIIRCVLL